MSMLAGPLAART